MPKEAPAFAHGLSVTSHDTRNTTLFSFANYLAMRWRLRRACWRWRRTGAGAATAFDAIFIRVSPITFFRRDAAGRLETASAACHVLGFTTYCFFQKAGAA